MINGEKPAGGMHGALIACLVILLGLLVLTGFGAFLSLLLMDSPPRGLLAETSRWLLVLSLWLAPLAALWSVWQTVQQLRGKKPARFKPILLPPAAAIGFIAFCLFAGMIGWNA